MKRIITFYLITSLLPLAAGPTFTKNQNSAQTTAAQPAASAKPGSLTKKAAPEQKEITIPLRFRLGSSGVSLHAHQSALGRWLSSKLHSQPAPGIDFKLDLAPETKLESPLYETETDGSRFSIGIHLPANAKGLSASFYGAVAGLRQHESGRYALPADEGEGFKFGNRFHNNAAMGYFLCSARVVQTLAAYKNIGFNLFAQFPENKKNTHVIGCAIDGTVPLWQSKKSALVFEPGVCGVYAPRTVDSVLDTTQHTEQPWHKRAMTSLSSAMPHIGGISHAGTYVSSTLALSYEHTFVPGYTLQFGGGVHGLYGRAAEASEPFGTADVWTSYGKRDEFTVRERKMLSLHNYGTMCFVRARATFFTLSAYLTHDITSFHEGMTAGFIAGFSF